MINTANYFAKIYSNDDQWGSAMTTSGEVLSRQRLSGKWGCAEMGPWHVQPPTPQSATVLLMGMKLNFKIIWYSVVVATANSSWHHIEKREQAWRKEMDSKKGNYNLTRQPLGPVWCAADVGRELSCQDQVKRWEKGERRGGGGTKCQSFPAAQPLTVVSGLTCLFSWLSQTISCELRTPVKLDETSETLSILFFRNSLQNPLWCGSCLIIPACCPLKSHQGSWWGPQFCRKGVQVSPMWRHFLD